MCACLRVCLRVYVSVWTWCELKTPCTVEQSARFSVVFSSYDCFFLFFSSCYGSTGFVHVKQLTFVIQVVLVVVLGHPMLTSFFFFLYKYVYCYIDINTYINIYIWNVCFTFSLSFRDRTPQHFQVWRDEGRLLWSPRCCRAEIARLMAAPAGLCRGWLHTPLWIQDFSFIVMGPIKLGSGQHLALDVLVILGWKMEPKWRWKRTEQEVTWHSIVSQRAFSRHSSPNCQDDSALKRKNASYSLFLLLCVHWAISPQ